MQHAVSFCCHFVAFAQAFRHPDYEQGQQVLRPTNIAGAIFLSVLMYCIALFLFSKVSESFLSFPLTFGVIGFVLGFHLGGILFPNIPTKNDIALLRLCKPAQHIEPITIFKGDVPVNSQVQLLGFGSETGQPREHLHEGQSTAMSNQECAKQFIRGADSNVISDRSFCVRSEDVTPCRGDSGSPALIDGQLAGLSSWGARPCENHPSVYTTVGLHEEWISNTIQKHKQDKYVQVNGRNNVWAP